VLTVPYVTPAAFRAHPTYLDLLNLRSGDTSAADQTDELTNILLMASSEADNYVQMGVPSGGLGAHQATENVRLVTDRWGRLHFHASHIPVISIDSLSYGVSIGSMTTVTAPTVWVEDGRQVTADLSGATATWSGSLQFGAPVSAGLFTSWTYTAGFVNTTLAANVTAGATSITVANPVGITGGTSNTPATTLRIWDPGAEEAATVAATYVAGSTTVPLTTALTYAHTLTTASPIGVSGLTPELHLAIIQWGTALLMRPTSKSSSQFRGSSMRLSTAGDDDAWGDASGLVAAGRAALKPYRRIR
jgi:hypothetical protein